MQFEQLMSGPVVGSVVVKEREKDKGSDKGSEKDRDRNGDSEKSKEGEIERDKDGDQDDSPEDEREKEKEKEENPVISFARITQVINPCPCTFISFFFNSPSLLFSLSPSPCLLLPLTDTDTDRTMNELSYIRLYLQRDEISILLSHFISPLFLELYFFITFASQLYELVILFSFLPFFSSCLVFSFLHISFSYLLFSLFFLFSLPLFFFFF